MRRIFKIEAIKEWHNYAEIVIAVFSLISSVALIAVYKSSLLENSQSIVIQIAKYLVLANPLLCVLRLAWLSYKPLPNLYRWLSMTMDFLFLCAFMMALNGVYGTAIAGVISPAYAFFFGLLTLQALRFDRWQTLSLGVASVMAIKFLGSASAIKIGAMIAFSGLLFLIVAKAESLLSAAIENLTADTKLKEAKQTMAMKTRVIGTMSQELKTPMSGVLGMSEALRRTPLNAEQERYVDALENSGKALLTAIENIREFTQLESGALKAQTKPFDFSQTVESVAEKFGSNARRKNLDLILDIAPDSETYIIGSEKRFRQILSSLVDNAIKFTTEGHVFIKISCEALDSKVAALSVRIEDSGIGMSAEKIDHLLGHEAENEDTSGRAGRGLGLMIVQMLLKVQGEKLVIESTLGEGSAVSYSMHVPYKEKKQTPHPILGLRRSPSDLKILIVDDNVVAAEMLRTQLNAMGIMPQIVNDAQSACAAINAAHSSGMPYRVALVDYDMPEFDGLKLAKLIRTREELNKMKMIILSSSAEAHIKSEFAKLGVTAYLEKPMTETAIKDAIYSAMTGERASDIEKVRAA